MQRNNAFEQSLLSMLDKTRGHQNYIVSPASLRAALLLAIEGADGETKVALLKAAGFSSAGQADDWYRAIVADITRFYGEKRTIHDASGEDMHFHIANSVWSNADKRGDFSDDYKARVREKYDALADSTAGNQLQRAVNSWASEQTDGFIQHVVGDLTNVEALLVNALYLRVQWRGAFNKALTRRGAFNKALTRRGAFIAADGKTSEKEFLSKTSHLLYAENGDENKLIALPLRGDIQFVATLGDMGDVREALAGASTCKVRLRLPKINVESTCGKDIVDFVMVRGGELPFSDAADFSRMVVGSKWKIGDIIQKARLKTDEDGLEAAAVTVIQMLRGAALRPAEQETVKEFIADRPFRFYLIAEGSGELLFAGAINE